MTTRRAFLATLGSLAAAGCTSPWRDDGPVSPTGTSTDGTATTTDATATRTDATDTADGTPVAYVLRSGPVPDEFASLTARIHAVFVEDVGDLGPCYPAVYEGPYKPTITPIRTPSGACHREDPLEVDLLASGERTLQATAPPSASGHALIATEVVGTDQDGEAITAIKGTGGVRLVEAESAPADAYGVEIGIEAPDNDADYDYWVLTDRFSPDA